MGAVLLWGPEHLEQGLKRHMLVCFTVIEIYIRAQFRFVAGCRDVLDLETKTPNICWAPAASTTLSPRPRTQTLGGWNPWLLFAGLRNSDIPPSRQK